VCEEHICDVKYYLLFTTVVASPNQPPKQSRTRKLAPVKSGKYTLKHIPVSRVSDDVYGAQRTKEMDQMECSENGEDPDVSKNAHGICCFRAITFVL